MNGNYFCHVCGGLVDLIKLQPSDVRLCECEKRFAQLRAENERLKAELKSIDGALDDPRANLTLTTAEIIWEIKAELAEAKKDAERYRWLRNNPVWVGYDSDFRPDEIDAAIDAAMKGK